MKKTITTLTAAMMLGALIPAQAGDGVEVDFLGTNNTLVRVKGEGKYVLLPVQEANDDARVNIVVDGKLDKTINVRLAKNKVDYMVPFDLTPYKCKIGVMDIITN